MLLSGVLVGGQALANRAQVVDIPVGQGHVVSFAIRPFWRWQTQGTFFLGFNAILNWNDLDAGGRRRGRRRHSNLKSADYRAARTKARRPRAQLVSSAQEREGSNDCSRPLKPCVRPQCLPWLQYDRPMAGAQDVIVVGAGIIGCAVARELARRGAAVRLFEARTVGAGATQASAGILAPYIEAHERGPLFDLGRPHRLPSTTTSSPMSSAESGTRSRVPPLRDARGRARLQRPASRLRGMPPRPTVRCSGSSRRLRAAGRARSAHQSKALSSRPLMAMSPCRR